MTADHVRCSFWLTVPGLRCLLIAVLAASVGLPVTRAMAQSEQNTIIIHVPDVRTLPPAVVSNVRCHLRLVKKSPGEPGFGQLPSLPDCDQRSKVVPAAQPVSGDVSYHSGPVLTSAQQTFILLNCAATCWGNPTKFINDFFSSTFVHVLDQYMKPSVLTTSGRYTNNSTPISLSGSQPHTLQDSQLQTLILNAIEAAFPSGGGGGYNRMYSIFLPQGQDLCMNNSSCYCPDNNCGGGSWQFCAYHSSFDSTDAVGNPIHVVYLAMPYQDAGGGCTTPNGPNGTQTDSTNDGWSHELSESISDPDGNAWYRDSDGSEIGDICFPPEQNPIYLNGDVYEIQTEYSNAAHGCSGFFPYLAASHVFNGLKVQSSSVWSVSFNSDILWRDTGGDVAAWLMNGGTVLQSAALGTVPGSFSVIGQHDFSGDGDADLLWRDGSGNISMWFMNGTAVSSAAAVGNLTSNWTLYGTADLNGDGKGDLLWRDSTTGTVAVWFMNGATVASTTSFGALPSTWTIVGDANGDILWRDSAGDIALWGVQNGQVTSSSGLGTVTSNFVVQGVGDFNGDGKIDILWRDTNSGALAIWFTNGTQVTSGASVGALASNWSVAQVGDYNGDGKSDILLLDNAGDLAVWLMNGAAVSSAAGIGNVGPAWQVQNSNSN